MIIRKALIRQGHAIRTVPARSWSRCLATEVDIPSIEGSRDNTMKQTESIETKFQNETKRLVPQIDTRTNSTLKLSGDKTAEKYKQLQRHKKLTNPLGSSIAPHYEPHLLVNHPPRPSDITLELLLASQAHLGHKTSHWNPMNSRYIFGIRQGIHIISLEVIAAHLRRACRVVSGVAERGGLVLFAGTRPGQGRCVVKAAQLAGGCHLFERWTPGSITNGHQILGNCMTRVVDEFDRDVPGYERELQERPVLKPDLVVCLNPIENWVLLHECSLNAIPTIGIIDTNADPTSVTYQIPANDDSLRCVQVIAGVLGRAGEEGQRIRREKAMHGNVTYTPSVLGEEVTKGGSAGDLRRPQ